MVGYWAAMQRPPHLTCVLTYESNCSFYQFASRGGIKSTNWHEHWYHNTIVPYQAGRASGQLSEEKLAANRVDYPRLVKQTEYPTGGIFAIWDRVRRLSNINVPIYLAGNWTDTEVHQPGNIRAFNGVSSEHKWLEMHTGNHLSAFYEPEHIQRQRQFLDYFLFEKTDNSMLKQPRIRLIQHDGTRTFYREQETAFPPPDAEMVAFYLNPDGTLSTNKSSEAKISFEYQGLKENINFSLAEPLLESLEVLGSPYLELEVLTEALDMDLFIHLRAVDADGKTIVLRGNHDEPMDSFTRGYFRLSHRDEVACGFKEEGVIVQSAVPRSEVTADQIYTVTVPLYPTAYLFKEGQRLKLEIGAVNTQSMIPVMRHEGGDRTEERFGGKNVIYSHRKLVLPRVRRENL